MKVIALILSLLIAFSPQGICLSTDCCHTVEVSASADDECETTCCTKKSVEDSHTQDSHKDSSCHCYSGISTFALWNDIDFPAHEAFHDVELNSKIRFLIDRPYNSIWIPPNI